MEDNSMHRELNVKGLNYLEYKEVLFFVCFSAAEALEM